MAIKVELVEVMVNELHKHIQTDPAAWQAFLDTAAYMYKYDFTNQLAIHAQRPDAIACAGYSVWNRMGRYVKRGSKGIRMLHDTRFADRNYVFDAADTETLENERNIALWQADQNAVLQYLEEQDLEETDPITRLRKDIETKTYRHFALFANKRLDGVSKEDSQPVLDQLDQLAKLALSSNLYVIMRRTNIDMRMLHFDFGDVSALPEDLSFYDFGQAMQAAQAEILMSIERISKNALANNGNILYDKNKERTNVCVAVEGRKDNGTDLQMGRRLPGAESGVAEAADGRSGLLGTDESRVSKGTQIRRIFGNEHRRNIQTAPVGHRPGSGGDERNDDAASDEKIRDHRTAEGRGTDGMGSQGQSDSADHSGTDLKRSDLQLTTSEEQLSFSLFPSEKEQKEKLIKEQTEGGDEKIVPSFSLPQNVIDAALAVSPPESLRLSLCADFEKCLPAGRLAQRMERRWTGGRGFSMNGENYAIWADAEGLRIARGKTARFNPFAKSLTWVEAAEGVMALLESGSYLAEEAYSKARSHDLESAAAELWYMHHDMSDIAWRRNYMSHLRQACEKHNYPDGIVAIQALLAEPEDLQALTDEVRIFAAAYEKEPTLMRLHFYTPERVLIVLEDMARQRRVYRPQESSILRADGMYISDDEIDAEILSGGNVSGNRKRIADFFSQNHDAKEKAKFLKDAFGIGGRSGPEVIGAWHDAAGLLLRRPDCKEVNLTWQQVAKRMEDLLSKLPKEDQLKDTDLTEDVYSDFSVEITFSENQVLSEEIRDEKTYSFAYANRLLCEIDRLRHEAGEMHPDNPALMGYDKTYFTLKYVQNDEAKTYADRIDLGDGDLSLMNLFAKNPDLSDISGVLEKEAKKPLTQEEAKKLAAVLSRMQESLGEAGQIKGEGITAEPLEEMPKRLYKAFADLAPGIVTGDVQSLTLSAGRYDLDLAIERLSDTHVAMAHFVQPGGNLLADPDMEFVIDFQQQTLTPISYTNDVQSRIIEVASEDDAVDSEALSDLGEYALTWLTNLQEKRYTVKQEILGQENDQTEIYRLLDRLKSDCEYYLGAGGRHIKHLWAGNEAAQIVKMRQLYDQLREKPKWLSLEDIRRYETQMMPDGLASLEQAGENEAQNAPISEETASGQPVGVSEEKTPETACFALTDESLGTGTASEKFEANIMAIKTLKMLQEENRAATPEEKEILSRYTGWGGLSKAFEEGRVQNAELKARLSEEEYKSARDSVLNAHYTPPIVMDAMYRVLTNIGFEGGTVLEPACGIGNFFGRMPSSMRAKSYLRGVELDTLSGSMARAIYPEAKIQIKGFENTHFQDNAFDLAIGNIPFGDYSISDVYGKGFLIHDFFFAASLDKVHPGGVVAFITSSGTLDKKTSHVREYLACRADLLGAIRLPDMAFKANAGTETTTDIIFLQKRQDMRNGLAGLDWLDLAEDEQGLTYNQYFIRHPEMIVGKMREVSGPYGMRTVCKLDDGEEFRTRLLAAADKIQGSMQTVPLIELPEIEEEPDVNEYLAADIPAYSYGLDARGRVIYHEGEKFFCVICKPAEEERIKGMIQIRKAVRHLIDAQVGDADEETIIDLRTALNRAYDRYTEDFGLIHNRENRRAFEQDASFPLLLSLELVDEDGKLIRKADIFTKRTIRKSVPVTSVNTPQEALAVSLAEKGVADIPYMAKLAGCSEDAVIAGLKGQIYEVPGENRYVPADEYLSGNIREKMKAAKQYTGFEDNIKALEAVLPEPLEPGDISVRLGSTWIPVEIYKDFIYELLQTPLYRRSLHQIDLTYSPVLDAWNIKGKSLGGNVLVNTTYGTERANAYRIIESTMNLRSMQITDVVIDEDGKERRVVNAKETALACEKQNLIKEKFQNWIWEDPERRERLCEIYNERFNSIRPREYDGSYLSFPGMNSEVELREHQKRAVARQVYGGNTLLAHVVGAGKTYEIAAAVMERKRLGLSSKAMIVVPNHLIGQWASEFLTLYPAANILAVTKKDFEKSRRKAFCARIATSDVDAVIIAHSQFEMIPLSKERQVQFLQDQINQIQHEIKESAREDDRSFTVKQLVSMEKKLSKRLAESLAASRRDDVLDFEELGIDFLCVDEAHSYKNLALSTKMRNVAGISTGGANKSFDMYAKCRYMDEVTGGKGITFATGTPVSNSIAELYTMQRYLQYDLLQSLDMVTFDRWASTFAESITSYELSPEGSSYRQKTRFAKFFNLPELMAGFKECADIQTADMLQLDTPEPEYINIVLKPSERQKAMLKEIGERADRIRLGDVDAREDNMLKVTTDGRKLALDERLLPFDEGKPEPLDLELHQSKVEACAEKVKEIYQKTMVQSSTQLVFCDQSTPKEDGSFNVYDDLKKKLIALGITEGEIAFIHDAKTDAQKNDLFSKVRKGCVRVLIGSTSKMGAGMNVQNKLVALHHLDVPWKPADIQQQEGRILRQGNENHEVKIYRYITENTFDAYSWQLIENKLKFIGQMTSRAPVRSCEDIDDAVFSAAEAKAQATGDPRIKERIELESDVSRLRLSLGNYNNERYQMRDRLERILPKKIADLSERIEKVAADAAYITTHELLNSDDFLMTVGGKTYTARAEAGEVLLQAARNGDKDHFTPAGEYAGFILSVRAMDYSDDVDIKIERESSMVIDGGDSPVGVMIRIKNAIQKLPEKLSKLTEEKSAVEADMARIKKQITKPFEKKEELAEKEKRLKELTKLLEGKSEGIAKDNEKKEMRNKLRR